MNDKIERTVRALDHVLRQNHAGAPLSQIAESVSGPLSSTHDLLRSMVRAGLLSVDERKIYRIGPTFVRLAVSAVEQVDVVNAAIPHLRRLVQEVQHDAYLAVRIGNTVTYVERIPGLQRAGLDIRLGDPVPLHSSAVGKLFAALAPALESAALDSELVRFTPQTITTRSALEAELQAIRERDFSMSMEETISGVVGFAAPVRDHGGNIVAAVHVSAFRDYLANVDIPAVTSHTKACAAAIQGLLTHDSISEE